MIYFCFKKEDNDFSELLSDKTLKPLFGFKIRFHQHLILGNTNGIQDGVKSYLLLKYGDLLVDRIHMFKDFTPVMNVDYIPDPNRPELFKRNK